MCAWFRLGILAGPNSLDPELDLCAVVYSDQISGNLATSQKNDQDQRRS